MGAADPYLRPPQNVIPVLGAGVTQSAGLPGAGGLAEYLLDTHGHRNDYTDDPRSLTQVVDSLMNAGHAEIGLAASLGSYVGSWEPASSPLIEAMIRVPSRFIVTFNYDVTLEQAAEVQGQSVLTLGNSHKDLADAQRLLTGTWPPSALTVLHLHGSVMAPEEMVLGPEAYARMVDPARKLLYELAVHKRLVFYGTVLDEGYIVTELGTVTNRAEHVLWCRADEEPELTSGRLPLLRSRTGIVIRTVKHYDELAATVPVLPGHPVTHVPVLVPPIELEAVAYVPNRLVDNRVEDDREDAVRRSAGLPTAWPPALPPTETDVLDAPRTIVIGDPGTGKSELLRRLAADSSSSRPGVLIRLVDIGLEEASPRATLASWAARGTAAPGLDVGQGALDAGSYHFFLDGLDEVSNVLQNQIATEINTLARELPQHAFTVSSRPLPLLAFLALDAPESIDWRHITLAPDDQWRDLYLAERGVTLDRLQHEMPALLDMTDVLTTPFYLRHIVDLHDDGELAGLRDLSDVLNALVTSAIEREQSTLSLDNDAVSAWLRKVALAGVLAGRRTFTEPELREFALPEGATGDPAQLARALEQRLLLAEDHGSFRFHHRLLGEQVAADALIDAGPQPEILDCLVPFLDAALSGVRADAIVPVALACLRSQQWRDAVAARDPLAAARATPTQAAEPDRERALRALWQNALDSQIWVWDYGTQLTDDAEAMGRLGRTLSDTALAPILTAVHDGTPEDQGNAIRVLARARPDAIESDLRMLLADPDRNGVVLRQAAIAAADAAITPLIDDIVAMLVARPDSLVQQDGVHSLLRLTPPGRLLEIGRQLMGSKEADYVLTAIADRLAPAESVVLAGVYVSEGNDLERSWLTETVLAAMARVEAADVTRDVVAATVEIALTWHIESDDVIRICRSDRDTALKRLAEILAARDIGWWDGIRIAQIFTAQEMEGYALPQELVERVASQHAQQTPEGKTAAADAFAEGKVLAGKARKVRLERGEPATLGELLERPESERAQSDAEILGGLQRFARQVGDLSTSQRQALIGRLEAWWPEKPFRATITRLSTNEWRQEGTAAAWTWIGPLARPPLPVDRWAQLATCGVAMPELQKWLLETETSDGAYAAIGFLAGERDPRRWWHLLACCRDPLPNALLFACSESVDPQPDPSDEEGVVRQLTEIGHRFLRNDREDLALSLAARLPAFSNALMPLLADAGDVAAQERLLAELTDRVDGTDRPAVTELFWVKAIRSPALLPLLFGLLWRAYPDGEASPVSPPRVVSGYEPHDIINPMVEAIAAVGGRTAVAAYDDQIAAAPYMRWLSPQRERIALEVLTRDGHRFLKVAAARAGVPCLEGEVGS
ncbi:MAG: hypothetical protein JWM60_1701 [Solirubrobacterales bacterium]|nr:hypothetical protein [Solirubrobacterales bacterium]